MKEELHKEVWLAGFEGKVSADLQSYADEVIWLNDLWPRIRKPAPAPVRSGSIIYFPMNMIRPELRRKPRRPAGSLLPEDAAAPNLRGERPITSASWN